MTSNIPIIKFCRTPIVYITFIFILIYICLLFTLNNYFYKKSKKWIDTEVKESLILDNLILKNSNDSSSSTTTSPSPSKITEETRTEETSIEEKITITEDLIDNRIDTAILQKIERVDSESLRLIQERKQELINSLNNLNLAKETPKFDEEIRNIIEKINKIEQDILDSSLTSRTQEAKKCLKKYRQDTNSQDTNYIDDECSKFTLYFRQSDITRSHVRALTNDLQEWKSSNSKNINDKNRILEELEFMLMLTSISATEAEQFRLLEQSKTIKSRKDEAIDRTIFYFQNHATFLILLSITGISILIFLVRTNVEGLIEDNKSGSTERKRNLRIERAILLTNVIFFAFFWQIPQILQFEGNFKQNIQIYQKYNHLDNTLRTFIATSSFVDSNNNNFVKTSPNVFIQYVDGRLETLNKYFIATDPSIINSQFGSIIDLIESTPNQNTLPNIETEKSN